MKKVVFFFTLIFVIALVIIAVGLFFVKHSGYWQIKGEEYRKIGAFDKALKCYDTALKLEPQSPYIYYLWYEKVRCYAGLKNKAQTLEWLSRVFELSRYHRDRVKSDKEFQWLWNDADFKKLVDQKPTTFEGWMKEADYLYHWQDSEESIKAYDKAIKLEPKSLKAYDEKKDVLLRWNKYDEAVRTIDKIIEISPTSEVKYQRASILLHNLKRYDEVIAESDKAIERDPKDYLAWYNRACAYSLKQDNEKTYHDLAMAISLEKSEMIQARKERAFERIQYEEEFMKITGQLMNAETWYKKGQTLYDANKLDEAVKAYDKAMELVANPTYDLWNSKGLVLDDLGRHEEAVKAFEKAIEIRPKEGDAWYNKGNALEALGREKEAREAFKTANKVDSAYSDPSRAFVWSNKGVAFDNLGKYDKAIKAYDKALQLDPNFAMAWSNKGCVLFEQKKYSESLELCIKAIELEPELENAWVGKGTALIQLGRFDEGIEACNQAIKIKPDYGIAWLCRACAYSRKKDKEKALSDLAKSISLNSDCKDMAKKDTDFQWLWTDEEFKKLTE